MTACLILANGHNQGIQAPLEHGYYMIGRHGDCQIRPRSHSVSRRHCLLHHDHEHLRAYDLGSTNTTSVNDEPLKPNEWRVVQDGDQIRCGKVLFEVSFCPDKVKESRTTSAEDEHGAIRGEPWKQFDVLAFLEAEDEKEQLTLRDRHWESEPKNDRAGESNHVLDEDPAPHPSGTPSEIHVGTSLDVTGQGSASGTHRAERIAAIRARIKQSQSKSSKQPGRFKKATTKQQSPESGDVRPWLNYAAAVLMCVAFAGLAYSSYQSFVGPSPRVLEGID